MENINQVMLLPLIQQTWLLYHINPVKVCIITFKLKYNLKPDLNQNGLQINILSNWEPHKEL